MLARKPPENAIDASKLDRRELNKTLEHMLSTLGYAAVYNLRGHRYVANGLGPGKLELWGIIGNASLNLAEGLEVKIYGNAQEDLADSATDTRITVYGDVGDSAAQALRSGELHVIGNAGNRLAVQIKGGTVVVRGSVGDYMAEYMAGGTIIVLGKVGRYIATGMVGGKIYIADQVPPTNIGKAPHPRQVERYVKALERRGEITPDKAEKALEAKTIAELAEILGDRFKRLAKLWGVLHVGYPHSEYRYLTSDEEDEVREVLMRHVETTGVPLDIDQALTIKYTIITPVRLTH